MIHDLESASEAASQWREDICDVLLDIQRVIEARVHVSKPPMHPVAARLSKAALAAMECEADALFAEREAELGLTAKSPEPTASAWPFVVTVLKDPAQPDEDEPAPEPIEPPPEPEQLTIFDEVEAGCGCAGRQIAVDMPDKGQIVQVPVIVLPAKKLRTVTMSPSKLGLLLHECERCFVRDVRDHVPRPGLVAEIYNIADDATKLAFDGAMKRDGVVNLGAPGVPRFEVVTHNLNLLSTPIPFDDLGVAVQIKGRLDALVRTDDARQLIVDYKTSKRDVDLKKYIGQLGAYALAMAWPVDGVVPVEVDATALLVLAPDAVSIREPKLAISGSLKWVDVPRDDVKTVNILERAAALVTGDVAPILNQKCPWCVYYGAVPMPVGELR